MASFAELVGVLEAARFVLEPRVLAVDELRVLDLPRDVPQVVGALLRLRAPRRERRDLARESPTSSPCASRTAAASVSAPPNASRIGALRFAVEQRLRFVLAVQIHERRGRSRPAPSRSRSCR